MSEFCKCEWPESSRHDVNRCTYCYRYIPVQESDMTPEQRARRMKFQASNVPWPKSR